MRKRFFLMAAPVVPFATKTTTPLQSVTATIKEVKHNIEIDDSSFSKPKNP